VIVNQVLQSGVPFEVGSLESGELMQLFDEASSYVQGIAVEAVADQGTFLGGEKTTAILTGIDGPIPVIRFLDTLGRGERIEAIGHELAHLLLIHRFGLRLVRLKQSFLEGSDQESTTPMSHHGSSLLGQIGNTAHHLFLVGYLKDQYGIGSGIHCRLLHRHFLRFCYESRLLANEAREDTEAFYGEGIIAFEYGKLFGRLGGVRSMPNQTDSFRKAVRSAEACFGRYGFHSLPPPSSYEEDVKSLLGDLGYERKDFVFLP
jgi:hypothetical protein